MERRVDSVWASVLSAGWEVCGPIERGEAGGALLMRRAHDGAPGAERGLVSRQAYEATDLSFEAHVSPGTCFIAKVQQQGQLDQTTNSYHLYWQGRQAYLARHGRVLRWAPLAPGTWQRLRLTAGDGALTLYHEGRLVCRVRDGLLGHGYAFLGLKGGQACLRNVSVGPLARDDAAGEGPAFDVIHDGRGPGRPHVSIVTTVYDRTDCLRRCLRSVKRLAYRDYEQIVVADAPPPEVVEEITRIVREEDDGRLAFLNLRRRHNNWGIAPAGVGLRHSRGELLAFLSDDNGYLPEHLTLLVRALDQDPRLGFAYSSCLYGGGVLRSPVPRPARIDLGQPLFRRELFDVHLGDQLPFDLMAWDWAMIDTFLKKGVRWRHVDKATFVFRLARYPDLAAAVS